MNKTLESLIKEKRYKDYNFKIGSKGGSSFWLCKKNHNGLSTDIQRTYQKCCAKSKKTLKDLTDRYEKLDKIYEQRITDQLKKGVKNPQEYRAKQEHLRDIEKRQLPKKIAQIQSDLETPFLERKVKATYMGICDDEKPCLILYITGCERGEYWTLKEYEKKWRKE